MFFDILQCVCQGKKDAMLPVIGWLGVISIFKGHVINDNWMGARMYSPFANRSFDFEQRCVVVIIQIKSFAEVKDALKSFIFTNSIVNRNGDAHILFLSRLTYGARLKTGCNSFCIFGETDNLLHSLKLWACSKVESRIAGSAPECVTSRG